MADVTRQLSEFAVNITYDQLPAEVAERVKLLVFDTVGIALRARHDADSTPPMLASVKTLGMGIGSARVIGSSETYGPAAAALINGALAHSLDFDDTHSGGSIHPSAPIMPAALAAAEMTGASGKDVIAAIAAGYEVQIRLSMALNPSDHYARGFHPSATCGSFGAAAAAGRLFGLSAERMASAFGIALSQTSGSLSFLVDGAWTKRSQVGWAALNGLVAAQMSRDGYVGSGDAIESTKAGFLHAYAPNPAPELAVKGLGEVWETMLIGVKPYPSCRYTHSSMDALIALREKHAITEAEIDAVEVGLPKTGWHIIGEEEHEKQNPKTAVDGQFSMPFCAAVVLRQGALGWDDYARHLTDETTLALTRKVTTVIDPKAEAEFPANMAGVVRVTTKRGTFEGFAAVPKGEPSNFPTDDEFRSKFDALTEPYLTGERRDQLASALLSLEKAETIGGVLELTRPDIDQPLRMAGED
ncbi:MAG: MmgE/PrpD family protein [Rhodospirillaceae bacterium]|nr:MmgE/PrpD family protein [Rhodospirillaceae bacterium]